jgi:hypothetical protein
MREVGFKQAMQGVMGMAVNADWKVIDADAFQEAFVRDPVAGGRLFTDFLRTRGQMRVVQQIIVASAAQLPAWKTVEIGKTATEWVAELEANGTPATGWAGNIMGKPAFTRMTAPTLIELIRAEVQHLGFTDPENLPTWQEILDRAVLLGFAVDLPEAGPASRLVAGDDDNFLVATMKPITDSGGLPHAFYVFRSGRGPVLNAHSVRPSDQFYLAAQLVLARCKVLVSAT